jgi:endoglucanase
MISGDFQMTATMRRILSCVFVVLAFAAVVPAAAQSAAPFRRGISLFHPLISAKLQPGSKTAFVFPPFADAGHQLTSGQLAAIKKAGFDFVRLPVDPGPFLQFKGTQRDALDDIMRQRLQMILGAGLAVIVDFHPIVSSVDYGPKSLLQGADTPMFQAYCDMLTRTARLLDTFHTNRVALELMNEPPTGGTADSNATWQTMAEKLYHSARTGSPNLTLIVAGGQGDGFDGLTALDPTPFKSDPAVIFTFHYYDPGVFTHQSYAGIPNFRVVEDVPYPSNARPITDSLAAMAVHVKNIDPTLAQQTTDIARGTAYLLNYAKEGFGAAEIQKNFDAVAAWGQKYGIPPSRIYLGEFGVIRRFENYYGAREPERLQWLGDVRHAAESHGFIWSIWSYSGSGGMEIRKTDTSDDIDQNTLKALGLP